MSKAQYAILRFAKYKGPTISRIEAHNERTKEFYASKLDAIKRQGKRTDLTSSPLDNKLKGITAAQQISEKSGDSQPQIYRYIRLTALIPELLDLVDNSVLKEKDKLQMPCGLR